MRLFVLTIAAWAFALPLSVRAEEVPPLKQAEASRVIYEAGLAARDPILLLAAARMRRGLGLVQGDRQADGGTPGENALDWQAMMDAARDAAGGDEVILGLIEDAEAEASKGVLNGPVYNISVLAAGGKDVYGDVPFQAGKYAEIYVEATGSEDLNLHVYDAQNRLVCSDTDPSAIAYCGWRPRSDAAFTIQVTNASDGRSKYRMITN